MLLCGENHFGDDDFRVAGMNHLLDHDATLREILDLRDGYKAERKFVGGPWSRRVLLE